MDATFGSRLESGLWSCMDLHIPVFDPSERKQVRSRCRSRACVVIEEHPYTFFHWFGCISLAVYLHHVIEHHWKLGGQRPKWSVIKRINAEIGAFKIAHLGKNLGSVIEGKETIEMYSYTINLVEMADTAEGGELQCGGVDLTFNPCGDHRTFKTTLERGCDTIPCYIPKAGGVSNVDQPWAYMSMTDPRFFPKCAILEQIDTQQLGKSTNFWIYPFDDAPFGRIGDVSSVFDTRDQANQLSHDLCRNLRHKIGNCRGSAFKCDEGGWVDIDAIIADYEVNLFPPNTSKRKRYMAIVEAMRWQDSGYKKSRFQILAARFPSIMNPNDTRAAKQELLNICHTQDEVNEIFSRCVGWYRPWCIRATTGHSDFGFMSSSALASRYSARMGDVLGGAFHVTYVENLPNIVRRGLVPGVLVAETDWRCISGHSLHGTR